MPRVVVRRRRHKPPAIRREPSNHPAFVANGVDDLHGAHVVNARVQAHFIQHEHPRVARLVVQRTHLRTHVTRGDDVNPGGNGHARHVHVHEGRKHADHQVGLGNAGVALGGVVRGHAKRLPARVIRDFGLRHRAVQVAHLHVPSLGLRLAKDVRDQRRTRPPRPQNQDHLFHAVKGRAVGLAQQLPDPRIRTFGATTRSP